MRPCTICRTAEPVTAFDCPGCHVPLQPGCIEVTFFTCCPVCAALVRTCDYRGLAHILRMASVESTGADPGEPLLVMFRQLAAGMVACAQETWLTAPPSVN